jgi:hypothetical protein
LIVEFGFGAALAANAPDANPGAKVATPAAAALPRKPRRLIWPF